MGAKTTSEQRHPEEKVASDNTAKRLAGRGEFSLPPAILLLTKRLIRAPKSRAAGEWKFRRYYWSWSASERPYQFPCARTPGVMTKEEGEAGKLMGPVLKLSPPTKFEDPSST
jgi:hypothetical protein